eukprot:Tbor_TRINITY_DN4743_c0_g1::TRINITY_DN4743_c0_g1_i1::g.17022::m.17022
MPSQCCSACGKDLKAIVLRRGFGVTEREWQANLGIHRDRLSKLKSTMVQDITKKGNTTPRKFNSREDVTKSTSRKKICKCEGDISSSVFVLDSMSPDERSQCDSLVTLLAGKSETETRSILEAIFISAESKRLLKNYGGVYPGFSGGNAIVSSRSSSGGNCVNDFTINVQQYRYIDKKTTTTNTMGESGYTTIPTSTTKKPDSIIDE